MIVKGLGQRKTITKFKSCDVISEQRIQNPNKFDKRSFRFTTAGQPGTKLLKGDNVVLTIGCPKGQWDPRRPKGKQCKVGTEVQAEKVVRCTRGIMGQVPFVTKFINKRRALSIFNRVRNRAEQLQADLNLLRADYASGIALVRKRITGRKTDKKLTESNSKAFAALREAQKIMCNKKCSGGINAISPGKEKEE